MNLLSAVFILYILVLLVGTVYALTYQIKHTPVPVLWTLPLALVNEVVTTFYYSELWNNLLYTIIQSYCYFTMVKYFITNRSFQYLFCIWIIGWIAIILAYYIGYPLHYLYLWDYLTLYILFSIIAYRYAERINLPLVWAGIIFLLADLSFSIINTLLLYQGLFHERNDYISIAFQGAYTIFFAYLIIKIHMQLKQIKTK